MVGLRQQGGRGRRHLSDRGDQRDHLAFPVTVAAGNLILDHPDVAGLVFVQVFPGAGGIDELPAGLAADLRVHQHRGIRPVGQHVQHCS